MSSDIHKWPDNCVIVHREKRPMYEISIARKFCDCEDKIKQKYCPEYFVRVDAFNDISYGKYSPFKEDKATEEQIVSFIIATYDELVPHIQQKNMEAEKENGTFIKQ